MSFLSRAKPANPSKVVLPITPMLDVTFQLLFFFVVNFRGMPLSLEGQLPVALPQERAVAPGNAGPAGPAEFPSDLTVKVRTQLDGANDGAISALTIQNAQGKEQAVEGGLPGLKAQLKQMRGGLKEKSNVKVQGDCRLKVKNLMAVMDACKAAGFENVSMVPPEDFAR
jgi:biopolymer transport protein ExbD